MSHLPVADFATDFDHTDPAWVNDPYPIYEDLRARCPVAHSDRYGGAWLPVRHEDVAAIADGVIGTQSNPATFAIRIAITSPTACNPGPMRSRQLRP